MAYDKETLEALSSFKNPYNNLVLYNAGYPRYAHFFTRDSIISAILLRDAVMLRDTLSFCIEKQGKTEDSYSGEEVGKIIHEYPGVTIRGLSTSYNACDSTAMFLVGCSLYRDWTGDEEFIESNLGAIKSAVNYIKKHIHNGAFIENPENSFAKRFALKVTYWKDSELFGRRNGEPVYPVIYTLAHVQNICALRAGAKLLNDSSLSVIAHGMVLYLNKKLLDFKNSFLIVLDKDGGISVPSSDFLHMLSYLNQGDLSEQSLNKIADLSSGLETSVGFRTLGKEESQFMTDHYHSKTVWPFEQAFINNGAKKFRLWAEESGFHYLVEKLSHIEEVSARTNAMLSDTSIPELFIIDSLDEVRNGGNKKQLWTLAAKYYFSQSIQDGLVL